MSSAGAAAALGKRNSEPRSAKRGAKAARGDLADATSPPPFSPMSPTAQLSRAFSAMPIMDGSSSSSSDPPSSPGRASEAAAAQRAVSLDSMSLTQDSKARSPKGRAAAKPRSSKAGERASEKKRQGDPTPAEPMSVTPAPVPAAALPVAVAAPAPAAASVAAPREKKKLNLPRPGALVPMRASLACPYCKSELEEAALIVHVFSEHAEANPLVVCPICAQAPGGDTNMKSRNFQGHLQARHGGAQVAVRPRKIAAPPPVEGESVQNDDEDNEEGDQESHFVMVTTNLNRLRDRSLEGIWDYMLSFDPQTRPARCEACSARLAPTEATCLLHCGHSFHATCLSETDPDPECPLCLSMGKDCDMKD